MTPSPGWSGGPGRGFPRRLACFAEDVLLEAGRRADAYERYSIAANQAQSRLSTYRAIAAKYPEVAADRLLADLIASTPGEAGKWFATAKALRRLDLAAKLAWYSPCDPRTLIRAARDHLAAEPAFALEAALAALHWISRGHGYELTELDVREAGRYALQAGEYRIGRDEVRVRLQQMIEAGCAQAAWMLRALDLADQTQAAGCP